jgi:diguanylate cyclase (GGDEF)-like protein
VLTGPVVQANRGEVIKYVADNMLAVFGDTGDAVAAAVGINRALQSAAVPAGTEPISVSIGISVYPRDGNDGETLLKKADTAMYRVKERGKGGFEFYSDAATL